MNELLNRVFGLTSMGFGDADVQFGFARPIPAWGWMLAMVAAFAMAWWSYWKLSGSRPARVTLAGLRGLVLLGLLLIFSGPQLVKRPSTTPATWASAPLRRRVERQRSMR